jgi:hypothetical protein
MSALNFLKRWGVFYNEEGFYAYGEFGEKKVMEAMVEFSNGVNEEIKKECKRVKIQRNEYEQQLLKANREIIRLRAELKM